MASQTLVLRRTSLIHESMYRFRGNAAAGTRIRMLVSMLEEKENQWSRAAQRESSHRISLRNFWNFC
ncbi:hypothetical protein Y032_0893g2903 [Ancylostoma ceylanicum]|uniref:Uncharacterized protein n=1 Tax=Ancylostoma ceylanicum TaxID=53326 RepID=A0A016W9F9_9BILA|nr:hypothetical protein Y032_0893g2903 [Ancylostoma ceylanicum]